MSGDKCNNVPIPANVTSVAALEQCYLGTTHAECVGAPAFAPAPYTAEARAAAFTVLSQCRVRCRVGRVSDYCIL